MAVRDVMDYIRRNKVNKARLAGERFLPPPWAPRELAAAFDTFSSPYVVVIAYYS